MKILPLVLGVFMLGAVSARAEGGHGGDEVESSSKTSGPLATLNAKAKEFQNKQMPQAVRRLIVQCVRNDVNSRRVSDAQWKQLASILTDACSTRDMGKLSGLLGTCAKMHLEKPLMKNLTLEQMRVKVLTLPGSRGKDVLESLTSPGISCYRLALEAQAALFVGGSLSKFSWQMCHAGDGSRWVEYSPEIGGAYGIGAAAVAKISQTERERFAQSIRAGDFTVDYGNSQDNRGIITAGAVLALQAGYKNGLTEVTDHGVGVGVGLLYRDGNAAAALNLPVLPLPPDDDAALPASCK